MTWRTQIGERVLTGAEAALFREAIGTAVDMVDEELSGLNEQWEFGVPVFDTLEPSVRLALLAQVGHALLRETDECPPLTAVNEGAIGALFQHIEQSVLFEIDCEQDFEDGFSWRRQILAVFREDDDTEDLPSVRCADKGEWEILLQTLCDRILWDEDFLDASLYLDKSPEQSRFLKRFMTIDDDYFTAVPPDPRDADLPGIRLAIAELVRADRPPNPVKQLRLFRPTRDASDADTAGG